MRTGLLKDAVAILLLMGFVAVVAMMSGATENVREVVYLSRPGIPVASEDI